MAKDAMVKIIAKQEVHAAPPPPPALDLLTEKPVQQAKNEKIVASTMHAWIPMLSGGMIKLPCASQSPLLVAHGFKGEEAELVF